MARRRNDGFEQSSIIDYIFWPFRALWNWGSALAGNDQIRDQQSTSVVSILLFPVRLLFSWILFLVNSWAVTRQVRPFLFGIPALVVVTGVSGATWLDYFRYPNKVSKSQQYFEKFLFNRGPEIAHTFALKRVGLQPEDLNAKYVLAENLGRLDQVAKPEEKRGDFLRMLDLMTYLADQGYLQSHVWFARFYLGDRTELSEEERAEKIESHLERAVQIDANNTDVKIALFDYSLTKALRTTKEDPEYKRFLADAQAHLMVEEKNERTGETEKRFAEFVGNGDVFGHLPKIMKVMIELAELADSENEKEFRTNQARAVLEGSQKEMYRSMQKFPGHESIPQIWFTLINSAIQLKDYSAAAKYIEDGERQASNATWAGMFGELKTALLMAQVNDLKDLESGEQFDQALEILGQGIMKSPADPMISNRLVNFIVPDDESGKDLAEQLKRSKSVKAPAVAHLLLGMHLVLNGDALGGQQHWRIAETQSPLASIILFSMTRSLVTVFADKFENRGDVIALAIEHFPNEGSFYLLRGVDAMNQGQFRQAIPDLEVAVEKVNENNKFEARIQLALCFRELNERDKFDEQRRTLQSMVSRLHPSRRGNAEEVLRQLDQ